MADPASKLQGSQHSSRRDIGPVTWLCRFRQTVCGFISWTPPLRTLHAISRHRHTSIASISDWKALSRRNGRYLAACVWSARTEPLQIVLAQAEEAYLSLFLFDASIDCIVMHTATALRTEPIQLIRLCCRARSFGRNGDLRSGSVPGDHSVPSSVSVFRLTRDSRTIHTDLISMRRYARLSRRAGG